MRCEGQVGIDGETKETANRMKERRPPGRSLEGFRSFLGWLRSSLGFCSSLGFKPVQTEKKQYIAKRAHPVYVKPTINIYRMYSLTMITRVLSMSD